MSPDRLLKLLCGVVLLVGCRQPSEDAPSPPATAPTQTSAPASAEGEQGAVTDWAALMPEENTFQRPPPQIGLSRSNGLGGVGGLINDSGSGTLPGQVIDHSSPLRAKQFGSSEAIQDLDGRTVSLDGFVVPLGMNDAGLVDELLFVPFYGACIHVPPPPPNQIIHVSLAKPIALGALWDPYRLVGRLQVKRFDADIASASYEVSNATLSVR
jgi:uncharacterized protein